MLLSFSLTHSRTRPDTPLYIRAYSSETWSVSQSADRLALLLESDSEISHVSELNSSRTRAFGGEEDETSFFDSFEREDGPILFESIVIADKGA
jgi:hypothetical protein